MENSKLYTVKEYADIIGFSAQYIYKQIELGKLKKVIKSGLTYVEVSPNDSFEPKNNQTNSQQNLKEVDNKFVEYLSTEVERLNRIVETLQTQLLECKNENINRIVELNERKDAQLTKYIEFLNNSTQQLIAQAIHRQNQPQAETFHKADLHEAEIIETDIEPIKLSSYLKSLHYSKDEIKKIQLAANKAFVKNSKRFILMNEKMYIFPTLHNYDDIL